MAIIKGAQGIPRAVIYTRISTEGQSDNTSLAGQYAACAKRAQDEGALVVEAFAETKSGGLYESRGELQKALALIEDGKAQMLILAKLDRGGRDVEDLRDVKRRVEEAGGRMVFADGMNFEKGAVGNLMFTQLSAFAEFERELIKERMVAGLERVAKSGANPSCTTPPYGYFLVTKAHIIRREFPPEAKGTYILNPEESPHIAPIFEMVAAGKSLRKIAEALDEQGIKPRRAKQWNITALRNIIINPVYKGKPVWRKTKRSVDEKRAKIGLRVGYTRPRPVEEQIELAPAPALVSEALWLRANRVMETGRVERSGNQERRYLLAGFVRCHLCGDRMHSRLAVRVHGDGKRQKVWMYRCAGAVRGVCALPSFGGPQMESHVIHALQELLNTPHYVEAANTAYVAEQERKRKQALQGPSLKTLRQQLDRALSKERALAEAMIEARMAGRDGSAFALLQSEAETARQKLEQQIELIERASASVVAEVPEVLTSVDPFLLTSVLTDDSVPPQVKASILRPLVSRVYPVRFCDTSLPAEQLPLLSGKGQSTRTLAGVKVVLNVAAELNGQGPYFVLSRVATRRFQTPGAKGRLKWDVEFDTTLIVSDKDPFPPLPAHCQATHLERQNLRE